MVPSGCAPHSSGYRELPHSRPQRLQVQCQGLHDLSDYTASAFILGCGDVGAVVCEYVVCGVGESRCIH